VKLLDRSIARHYLFNVIALFVILFSFVVVVDVALNIDRFINVADKLAAEGGGENTFVRRTLITILVIADLWWPRLLQLYNFMLGLVLVGAMGFTATQMVRHRELVAVLASGQSLYRVCRPILLVALALTALQAVNQEIIIPRIAPLLLRDQSEAGQRSLRETNVPLTQDGRRRVWYANSFDGADEVLKGLHVVVRDGEGLASNVITAETARWDGQAWVLEGGQMIGQQSSGAEAPRPEPVERIETDLSPTAIKIRRYEGYSQSLGFAQAGQILKLASEQDADGAAVRERRDRLERVRWGRFAVMTTNILALLVCMPFFIQRMPTNMVLQSLKCAPVAIGSLMGGVLGASAAIPGVPPMISVFIPAMIMLPVAVANMSSLKT